MLLPDLRFCDLGPRRTAHRLRRADAILTATDAATPVEELAANFVAQEKLTLAPESFIKAY